MTAVHDFPREWYGFSKVTFRLLSRSQTANRPWLAGKSVYGPHAQLWVADLTMIQQEDPQRQKIAAWFTRLDGQAGLLRISDPSRLRPWHDRNVAVTRETFSDGSVFSDSTGFEDDTLPPDLYVVEAASRGDNYLVLGGLPASTTDCFLRGDLMQVKPNGIAGPVPHLYEMMVGGSSDAAGQIGVEIRPRLRTDIAAGDQVSLRYPSTVFRLSDDSQGAMEMTPPVVGNVGFSLIEALDQVS